MDPDQVEVVNSQGRTEINPCIGNFDGGLSIDCPKAESSNQHFHFDW
jgi:hypothetical protein